jgi:hypothetical protein
MWTVFINDGFCEYKYEFKGGGSNCIDDVAKAILSGTDLKLTDPPVIIKNYVTGIPKKEFKHKTRFEILKEESIAF